MTRKEWSGARPTGGVEVVVCSKQRLFPDSGVEVAVVQRLPHCQERSEMIPECQLTPFSSSSGTAPPRSSRAHVESEREGITQRVQPH